MRIRTKSARTKSLSWKAKTALLTIGALLLAGGIAYYFVHRANVVAANNDKARFSEADQKQQMVFDELLQKVGATPIQTVNRDLCYSSEQGPYDHGRLWCQVSEIAYFSGDTPVLSTESVKIYFDDIVREHSLKTTNQRAADLEFEGADRLPCEVELITGEFAKDSTNYFPGNADANQSIAVLCADRAKINHYPYISWD